MAVTPSLTTPVPRAADPYTGLLHSKYICGRLLNTAGTAETVTVPQNAYAVNIAATDHFVARFAPLGDANPAVWPSDIDDGSQPGELNPGFRHLPPDGSIGQISLVANSANVAVTLSFYIKAP